MKHITIFLLLCYALSIQAQQATDIAKQTHNFTVRGEIIDSLSDEPVPYATVQILSDEQNQKLVKATITDENGKFSATISQKGNYLLAVSFIGKKSVHIPFSIGDKPVIDFGKITMDDDRQLLSEIVVSSQKLLVKVDLDKLTYKIEDDPDAKANNVLEMLKKLPMVTVDGEENVQLKGSTEFKYYINGKPSTMLENNSRDVLRGMPASTVKSIEVITDPGAKYDAEGVAGIINIVTQKQSSFDGYTASVNSTLDDAGGFRTGIYLSLKYGKIGFSGSLDGVGNIDGTGMTLFKRDLLSFREDYANSNHHYLNQESRSTTSRDRLTGFMELSYEIDTLNLIGITFNRNSISDAYILFSDVRMRNSMNETAYQYAQQTDQIQRYGNTGAGIDYQRSFAMKYRLLTASYRFNNSFGNLDYDNTIIGNMNFSNDHNKQHSKNSTDEHTFQLDYTTPIREIHTVETGIKYIKRICEVNSGISRLSGDIWTSVPSDRDQFRYRQNIVAVYTGYSVKYKQWGFKTGVRYEGTWLNVEFPTNGAMNFDVNYSNLIPSGILTYQINKRQSLRGGYSMRISRPGITYLNPYRNTADSLYVQFGNPNLQAVKYHTYNLNYNYIKPKLNTSINVFYNQTNNDVSADTWIENGISYTTYKNIAKAKRLNIEFFLNYSPTPKHRVYLNLRGNYADLQSNENGDIHRSGYGGSVSVGSQHTLPYAFRFNVVLYYSAPEITLQSKEGAYFFHNFALSRSFLDNKLSFRATVYNPFSDRLHYTTTKDMPEYYYKLHSYRNRVRWGEFTVSYRFGEMKKQIKKAQRTIKNDDVMEVETTEK
jgi:outer membrane receptor protein involved in Fe transport